VKQRLVDAVNKKDADALFAEMSPDIYFTAMNNDHVHGLKDGRAYYDRMLKGASSFLNNMSIMSEVDDPAKLYADNQVAVATGVSNTHFDIRGGLAFDVPLRWTATWEMEARRNSFLGRHRQQSAPLRGNCVLEVGRFRSRYHLPPGRLLDRPHQAKEGIIST
jgi:ketosteroid isomerase-like protein